MEDYDSIDGLEQAFSRKVSLIRESLELQHMDEDAISNLCPLEASLFEVQNICLLIKEEIKGGQEKLKEMQDLLKRIQNLKKRLDHMEDNFPSVLKKPDVPLQKNTAAENKDIPTTPCIGKKCQMPAKIKHLTVEEFEKVPKYMKGRIGYDQINNFIDDFNKAIEAKYKLLSIPRKRMKPSDYKICSNMKLQENDNTKGFFFCTSENLRDYANIKMDKTISSYLTILRHCVRTKEIRGPGPLIRYAVVP